jgi:putative endonuclease
MAYYVYILTNQAKKPFYTGVTNNLVKRTFEHKEGALKGFTSKYHLYSLVWYEVHDDILEAIKREKQIKKWLREWKITLIESINPEWRDLFADII